MRNIVSAVRTLQSNCTVIRKCHGLCTFMDYTKLPIDLNGPPTRLDSTFCHSWWLPQRGGCANRWDRCSNKGVEYISNDVSFVKKEQGTSTIRFALLRNYLKVHPKDVCVVNSGIHDQIRVEDVTTYPYANKVTNFISYLRGGCGKIIWLTINAVRGDKNYKQNNTISKNWNDLVRKRLNLLFPEIGYIDLFPMSTKPEMHEDNIHLNQVYLQAVARFFQ